MTSLRRASIKELKACRATLGPYNQALGEMAREIKGLRDAMDSGSRPGIATILAMMDKADQLIAALDGHRRQAAVMDGIFARWIDDLS